MPVLTMDKTVTPGAVGLPDGVKEAGQRVDFKEDKFVLAIETKGYRLAWSRSAKCPCQPVNLQTQQPDPNCSLCSGTGWFLFAPATAVLRKDTVGELDAIQLKIVNNEAVIIRAIMSGIKAQVQPYDLIGARLEGMAAVTVRHENKLGYYDRLTNLDSTIVYAQIIKADGTNVLETNYIVRQVHLLRSETTVYASGTHYNVVDGEIQWVAGQAPATNTPIAIHYLTHPVWRIVDHPHALRTTPIKFKSGELNLETALPVQAMAKYEFLTVGGE